MCWRAGSWCSAFSIIVPTKDSAHVEIMRVGTFRPEWGGVAEKDIIE